MALIQCPECGKQISDKSSTCIHCGYPITTKSSHDPSNVNSPNLSHSSKPTNRFSYQNKKHIWLGVIGVVVLLLVV